ncbi:PKD domain-containing protein [Limibacter armeniacum]|uniref:PKD domain-containing protein n=1 Tax=Limibacter armeniacum TaxID=466084 RepID=UPI002FE643CA
MIRYKILNIIRLSAISGCLLFGLASCEKDESPENLPVSVGFKLANTVTEESPLEAPADVVLVNGSKNGLRYEWSFEGGYQKHDADQLAIATTVQPDTIHYELPGQYQIGLKVFDAQGAVQESSMTIEVVKPMPSMEIDKPAIEVADEVTFMAKAFTYEGKEVSYEWDFGNGTTSKEANPKITFDASGIYTVTLTVNDGVEVLTSTFEIEVKDELAKSIYFFDKESGKIWRKPLTVRSETEATATVFSANNALDIEVAGDKVFVFDAGTGNYFLGSGADGQVYAIDLLSGEQGSVLAGISTNNVPYSGTVVGNFLYYLDRREGLRSININDRDLTESNLPDYFVRNNTFHPFYNAYADPTNGDPGGIGWGNMNGDAQLVGDTFYWSKANNGQSIYTFSKDGTTPNARLLANISVKTFKVVGDKIYFTISVPSNGYDTGVYMCNLDGTNIVEIESYKDTEFDQLGNLDGLSYSTLVGITGLDVDEDNGYIYWSYRAVGQDPATSGIKRAKLDGTGVEMYVAGVVPMGLAIDQVKR